MACPKKVPTNKESDRMNISYAVPIDNISTESVVDDKTQHAYDRVSTSPSNLSTTAASINSENGNVTGWGTYDSSKCNTGFTSNFYYWNLFSVAEGEKLQKTVRMRDTENACLSNCLNVLQEKLAKKSNQLRKK